MKRYYCYLLILTAFTFYIKANGQRQSVSIINASTTVEYLKLLSDKPTMTVKTIKLKIKYFSDIDSGNADKQIEFVIASNAAPASSPAIASKRKSISGKDFSTKHDTLEIPISFVINAMEAFAPETFTIGLKDSTEEKGGYVRITLQDKPLEEPTNRTPSGFTYLNAVNFDFDNSSGNGYVGHLNLFAPDIGRINNRNNVPQDTIKRKGFARKTKVRLNDSFTRSRHTDSNFLNMFGMNLGIMKINYSKGSDSINTSYNYAENVLTNPLDTIKQGSKFYRQYNSLATTSKNSSWSFYFQPTLNLLYRKNFKLLIHAHAELFVNTWTTTTTVKNLVQRADSITESNYTNVKDSMLLDNKFEKSLTDPVTNTSKSTNLSFYWGLGLTMYTQLWDGGSLFVQPTFGLATAYKPPQKQVDEAKYSNHNLTENGKSWFHLTRFELKQQLNTSLQAVVGVNVRGRFRDDPTYAAYVGINLGLNGIKNLFKD